MKVRARGAVVSATALLLGLTGGGGSAYAQDLDPREIYEQAAPGTVQVLGKNYAGSGFIYNPDKGLIATAAHVVEGESSLKVVVEDRAPAPARVVGIDPCQDLAVLTFTSPQSDLKGLKFGPSKELQTADEVVSLGYPQALGDNPTAQKAAFTSGSVQNPNVVNAEPSVSMPRYPVSIQHSATVNPGNSGGPLLNSKGEVVGINTLSALQAQGQFYAITADHARPVLDVLAGGDIKNSPGWDLAAVDDPDLLADYELPEDQAIIEKAQKQLADAGVTGVLVQSAKTNSPAGKAKLTEGDVVTTIKDTPVTTVAEVCDILQSAEPGATLPMEGVYSYNADGKETKFGEAWTTDLVLSKKQNTG
ncbi:S1C family serine protease [Streptomyces sp. NPDC048603]|uniref:S1C family serine protease n=1 Tax=Streptomyces sp. NPDC048603 TaxID=3365577 RepID=UPI0037101ADF